MSAEQTERELTALFEGVDAPESLDLAWRERIAPEPVRRHQWGRALAAAAAVVVLGAGAVTVVLANRQPPTDPRPTDPMPTASVALTTTPVPDPSAPTTASSALPPGSSAPSAPPVGGLPGTGPGAPPGTEGPGPGPAPGPGATAPPRTGVPPVGWPAPGNVGVLPGTTLRSHGGDLRITTPGTVLSDLRVDGTIYVEAADVTLRGVYVAPVSGAGIRQVAPRLTIEDSTISGRYADTGIHQAAAGLTVRRVDITGVQVAISASSDASIVDCYLHGYRNAVAVDRGASRVLVRHGALSGDSGPDVALYDAAGAITDVTVENSRLGSVGSTGTAIAAPTESSGSRDVRIRNNRIYRDARPSIGWRADGPGFVWSGNATVEDGTPIGP